MLKVNYKLKIDDWAVSSADDPRTELIELEATRSLNSPTHECSILLHAMRSEAQGGLAGLASGAGEAFSVQIRGNAIQHGDQVKVELASGDQSDTVMTAQVESISSSLGRTKISGRTGMQRLVSTFLNQVYENQTLKQIVSDLGSQAEINIGEIETGNTYPYLVVHESKSLFRHMWELVMREGMDLYFDVDNKLMLKKFGKSNADHTLDFGTDILDVEIYNHQAIGEHILVYGESPSSNQGSDTWHWIAKDLSPFQGEAGQGVKTLALQDSVIRTKDAADTLAASRLGVIKAHSTRGRLKILGNPKVKLADAIQIKNAEKPELNGLFKVSSVRHVLNKQEGYVTYIEFTGLGG